MGNNAIWVCSDPHAPHWRVARPSSGKLILVGWRVSPVPMEGGVPQEVAMLLARCFTRLFQVSFITAGADSARRAEAAQELRIGSIRKLAAAFWGPRLSGRYFLVSTLRAELAATLFDAPGVSWTQQSQVALLSSSKSPPPSIDERVLWSLSPLEALDLAALGSYGVEAVVFPGVDGDVAGLVCSAEAEDRFVQALIEEAAAAGFACSVVDETAFANGLVPVDSASPSRS